MTHAMQRVMIIGQPGSGKSTLARALGERTGLPVFHMDHIHWKAGWEQRSDAEKDALVAEVHARDCWIFEGGHSRSYAARAARADTVIWLDRSLPLRLWRVVRRSWIWRGQPRPDLPDGCPEQFNAELLDFLGYIWRTRHRNRERMRDLMRDLVEGKTGVTLRSDRAVSAFLERVT